MNEQERMSEWQSRSIDRLSRKTMTERINTIDLINVHITPRIGFDFDFECFRFVFWFFFI